MASVPKWPWRLDGDRHRSLLTFEFDFRWFVSNKHIALCVSSRPSGECEEIVVPEALLPYLELPRGRVAEVGATTTSTIMGCQFKTVRVGPGDVLADPKYISLVRRLYPGCQLRCGNTYRTPIQAIWEGVVAALVMPLFNDA